MNKTTRAIMRVLDKHTGIIGSREISRELKRYGIDLTERTVRYHLRLLDAQGFTKVFGKEGHRITERGKEELKHGLVSEKVGFMISKIETLSYLTTLDLDTLRGEVILNVSFLPEESLADAMATLRTVFSSPYVMSDRMILKRSGEAIGEMTVPEGKVALGTVCSVTINGLFLKAGIPVASRFGGVAEIRDAGPARFTALISYEGSSLDPLEIFIRSRMSNVLGAVTTRSGSVLASFREIPVVCREEAQRLAEKMDGRGLKGILMIGNPNSPLLEVPVGIDKAGIVIVGGLNPVAAVEEMGIPTESKAMSALYEYAHMESFDDLLRRGA
ncbi:MAG: DUF128 domain-containing protein [Chloroflexota bacterium]